MNEQQVYEQERNFQREMIDKQQSGEPNAVYADSLREEKVTNIISQINPDILLEDIEHRIRGEKKNSYTKQWELIAKDNPNPISEELVANYISFLGAYLSQNTSLSNFSETEINNIMEIVVEYVRDDLSDNAEKYGLCKKTYIQVKTTVKQLVPRVIKNGMITYDTIEVPAELQIVSNEHTDYREFDRIGHIICQSTFSVLKQAQNGMLAKRIFSALRVTESLNGGQQKKGLELLKFW
jgi:hypothetical protein